MEDSLHREINNLMGKYNDLKEQTRWLINENQRITQIMLAQEIQIMERDKLLHVSPYQEL